MPFPTEPLAQVPVVAVQYAEPVPQYPHFEQQRRGLEQAPFPTEPLPQVPPCEERTGAGVGVDGGGALGRVGEPEIDISAQFQNCSGTNNTDDTRETSKQG